MIGLKHGVFFGLPSSMLQLLSHEKCRIYRNDRNSFEVVTIVGYDDAGVPEYNNASASLLCATFLKKG